MARMADPANADHREPARILPERFTTSSTAATDQLGRSGKIAPQLATLAADEMIAASRATAALLACRSPAALAPIRRAMTARARRLG